MLGYRLGCSQWDLRAIYTYYHNAASKTVKEANTPDEFLVQTNGSPNVGSTFSFQKGKNSLNYQTLDFVLGREFCLSDEISLYPFFGLRSIWLEQKLKSQASNTFAQEVRWSSNTRGLGAHLGSLLNVDLCNGLGVYLKSAASLLGCKNSYHHKILAFLGVDGFSQDLGDSLHLRGTGDQELLEITRANGAQYVPLASLEISAGLNWETILCGSCTTFSLGYDMIYYAHTPLVHRYFSLNPTVGASTNEMVGNILLHGLSFGANIAF